MKYLKSFNESVKTDVVPGTTYIIFICRKYNIKNYTINEDGSIDLDGNFYLHNSNGNLSRLPLKFRNVTGDFTCNYNQLTTLEGAPKSVGGGFYCGHNQLTTLEGAPQSVGGGFTCVNNQLTTLEGAPQTVGGDFDCFQNKLTTLEGSPQSVGGDFYCYNNKLINFSGFPEDFEGHFHCDGNPVCEIYNLFNDIKCIVLLNEFDVIQGTTVILDRLEMVYGQLGMDIPEDIKFKHYEII
jgi:hypothetical protein